MSVAINTIPILNCDGNPHSWVYGVSKRVLTRLGGCLTPIRELHVLLVVFGQLSRSVSFLQVAEFLRSLEDFHDSLDFIRVPSDFDGVRSDESYGTLRVYHEQSSIRDSSGSMEYSILLRQSSVFVGYQGIFYLDSDSLPYVVNPFHVRLNRVDAPPNDLDAHLVEIRFPLCETDYVGLTDWSEVSRICEEHHPLSFEID